MQTLVRLPAHRLDGARRVVKDDPLLSRIAEEFHQMPGLSLTMPQVCRLWSLDADTARMALHLLEEAHVLLCTDDGQYVLSGRGLPDTHLMDTLG